MNIRMPTALLLLCLNASYSFTMEWELLAIMEDNTWDISDSVYLMSDSEFVLVKGPTIVVYSLPEFMETKRVTFDQLPRMLENISTSRFGAQYTTNIYYSPVILKEQRMVSFDFKYYDFDDMILEINNARDRIVILKPLLLLLPEVGVTLELYYGQYLTGPGLNYYPSGNGNNLIPDWFNWRIRIKSENNSSRGINLNPMIEYLEIKSTRIETLTKENLVVNSGGFAHLNKYLKAFILFDDSKIIEYLSSELGSDRVLPRIDHKINSTIIRSLANGRYSDTSGSEVWGIQYSPISLPTELKMVSFPTAEQIISQALRRHDLVLMDYLLSSMKITTIPLPIFRQISNSPFDFSPRGNLFAFPEKDPATGLFKHWSVYRIILDGTINNNSVRVRSAPNTTGSILTQLNRGARVKVLDRTDDEETIGGQTNYWYQIRLSDRSEGWVFGAFLDVSRE